MVAEDAASKGAVGGEDDDVQVEVTAE